MIKTILRAAFCLFFFVTLANAQPVSLWSAATTPGDVSDPDSNSVELGVKFTSNVSGTVSAIRFYKGPNNVGPHTVNLWSPNGRRLATAVSTTETSSGWQTVAITPIQITAGRTYIASYHSPGHYADDTNYFAQAYSNGILHAPAGAGVYRYGTSSAFPTLVWNNSNYWVDIVFNPVSSSPVNGLCGSSNGAALSSAPTVNLCTAGTASAVTGTGPWSWSCAGSNGGTPASCSATVASSAVNGVCGTANGKAVSSAPTTNLCSAGTASAVTGSGPWNWSCAGSNGGTPASCSAPYSPAPINGQCGPANGVAASTAPTTGLCSVGLASSITGTGPWSWSCAGSNGGTPASCGTTSTQSSGVLPSDRDASANWRMAGLLSVGGIPARTTVCATVNPSGGNDTTNIQNAINNCPAGQVVSLAAGTFTVAGGSYILLNKGITVRGAGAGQTIVQHPTSTSCPPSSSQGAVMDCSSGGGNSEIFHVSPLGRYVGNATTACALTADAAAGAYSISVTSSCASLFHAGDVVLLDELSGAQWMPDPEYPSNNIWASSDYRVVYHIHNPSASGDDGNDVKCSYTINCDRVTNEIKQVKSVSGNTITFDSPVMISYRVSHTADLWHFQTPFLQMAGIENLTTAYGDNGSIEMDYCAYCWLYQVETKNYIGPSIELLFSFRPQVEHFYVHDAAWPVPGGAGYNIDLRYDTSEALIENGITILANKPMVARGSGAGSVIAYNYVDKQYIRDQDGWQEMGLNASHLVGPHHILFEGNWTSNMDSDATHGGSIYLTFFRNQATALRNSFIDLDSHAVQNDYLRCNGPNVYGGSPSRATGPQAYTYWVSFVGNVLGTANCTTAANGWYLNNSFGGPDNSNGIFLLGWYNGGKSINDPTTATIYPAIPPGVNGTTSSCTSSGTNCATILDGNFDFFSNAIHWATNDTNHVLPNSMYLTSKPAFFGTNTWPWVVPTTGTTYTLPAKARYDAGTPNSP
jgi:hypothetical protein